jgi:mRNA interferase RelE/StbE
MDYRIEWAAPALRELRKLDKPVARRILVAVTKLGSEPRPAGSRSLTGYPTGTTRIRVGDYRVVYVIDDDVVVVTVIRVAHRREAYRHL